MFFSDNFSNFGFPKLDRKIFCLGYEVGVVCLLGALSVVSVCEFGWLE